MNKIEKFELGHKYKVRKDSIVFGYDKVKNIWGEIKINKNIVLTFTAKTPSALFEEVEGEGDVIVLDTKEAFKLLVELSEKEYKNLPRLRI